MDYIRIYNQLIDKARLRLLEGYIETHHIIPKCIGGSNEVDNLVRLTAREHFLCHWLLARMHPTNAKLAYAFWAMCNQKNSRQDRYVPSSRIYQEAKEGAAIATSRRVKGSNNPKQSERMLLNNPNNMPGVKERQRAIKLGKEKSPETIEKMRQVMLGREVTWGSKISQTRLERGLGKNPKSEDHKKRIGDANRKPKERVECPHCHLVGGKSNMTRWHFDNCKNK